MLWDTIRKFYWIQRRFRNVSTICAKNRILYFPFLLCHTTPTPKNYRCPLRADSSPFPLIINSRVTRPPLPTKMGVRPLSDWTGAPFHFHSEGHAAQPTTQTEVGGASPDHASIPIGRQLRQAPPLRPDSLPYTLFTRANAFRQLCHRHHQCEYLLAKGVELGLSVQVIAVLADPVQSGVYALVVHPLALYVEEGALGEVVGEQGRRGPLGGVAVDEVEHQGDCHAHPHPSSGSTRR